ncbi:9262_t:CDS:10 [Diversispora eburnea]|uniref:9262_t:CDS:1 n=1 Tax=Diversispora eburnea TaxID=1213867 RepID=A0A9N8VEE1_9GLOM|nr:9262_t:CDS:10 [Diversispora eburnea]
MSYYQAFMIERPKNGLDIVQSRLKGAKTLNLELADYFKERATLEDNYVKGLQRLLNKSHVTDKSNLGTFANVWDAHILEIQSIIEMHMDFMMKLHEEVEVQLRTKVSSDPEWTNLKHQESNLSKLAREYEEKHTKVNKQRSKTEKRSGKKAEVFALELTHADWQSEWSKYLEKFQRADGSRLLNLKESFARFETIQADYYQRRAGDEMHNFCVKKSKNFEVIKNTPNGSASGSISGSTSGSINAQTSSPTASPNASQNALENVPQNTFESRIPVDSEIGSESKHFDGFSSNDDDSLSDVGFNSSLNQKNIQVEIKPSVTGDNEAETAREMSMVMTTLKSTPTIKQPNRRHHLSTPIINSDGINTIFGMNGMNTNLGRTNSLVQTSQAEITNHRRAVSDPEVQSRGLRASIIETVNVKSQGGEVIKILVTGEIRISYNYPVIRNNPNPIRIRITKFDTLEKATPNTLYLRAVPESSGLYDIDTGLLSISGIASVAVMKYQVHIDPTKKNLYVPLQIIPQWKCEPNLTSLAVNYRVNPECLLSSGDGGDGTLTDLSFLIPVDGDVETVQSKPTGIWSTEKQRMYWQLDDIDLSIPSERKRTLAQFETKRESNPTPIVVKFARKGQLLSGISLEIEKPMTNDTSNEYNIDEKGQTKFEGIVEFQEIIHQVVSGKFLALP